MRISDWSSDVCSSDLAADMRVVSIEAAAIGDVQIGRMLRVKPLSREQHMRVSWSCNLLDIGTRPVRPRQSRSHGAYPPMVEQQNAQRSEERRVGKEGVSTGRSRWSPYH